MRVLLIGIMKEMESLYEWLDISAECFEIELILSEDELSSKKYTCPIKSMTEIQEIKMEYDKVFVCSISYKKIKEVLMLLGFNEDDILEKEDICKFLSKKDRMNYYAREIYNCYHMKYISDNISVGEFTYGLPGRLTVEY